MIKKEITIRARNDELERHNVAGGPSKFELRRTDAGRKQQW
jgi:hypothetical protein